MIKLKDLSNVDYALTFIKVSRAGEGDYYLERQAKTTDVYFDSKRYVYESPSDLIKFKRWLAGAFARRGAPDAKVTGKFPTYHVTSQN